LTDALYKYVANQSVTSNIPEMKKQEPMEDAEECQSRGRNRKAMLVSVMVSDLHASPSLIPAEVLQNAFSNFWLFPKQIRTNEGNGEQETVVTKQIIPFPPPS